MTSENRADLPAPSGSEPHILIVDDDQQMRQLVSKFLRNNGLRVSGARDGLEMEQTLRSGLIDLVILDVMLPGRSGIDLCRQLRQSSTLPVIMLTARSDETERIVALELGADDYLTKPFSPRELLARIKAILRRSAHAELPSRKEGQGFIFDGWRLDPVKRELLDPSGAAVELSTAEYDLLHAFLEAPQRALSREQLLDLARNRVTMPFDRSIDVLISRLRGKIDPDEGRTMIKTIRGVGYMFTPHVSRS